MVAEELCFDLVENGEIDLDEGLHEFLVRVLQAVLQKRVHARFVGPSGLQLPVEVGHHEVGKPQKLGQEAETLQNVFVAEEVKEHGAVLLELFRASDFRLDSLEGDVFSREPDLWEAEDFRPIVAHLGVFEEDALKDAAGLFLVLFHGDSVPGHVLVEVFYSRVDVVLEKLVFPIPRRLLGAENPVAVAGGFRFAETFDDLMK